VKFLVNDGKYFTNAILNCTLKGKFFTSGGVKNKSLGDYVYLELKENELLIYNADDTMALEQTMFVEGLEDGNATVEASKLLQYLKKFGDNFTITMKDVIRITGGGKTASMGIVVNHPYYDMITVFKSRVNDYNFSQELKDYPAWSDRLSFETKITINSDTFIEAVSACEIVGTGIYKMDYGEDFSISSTDDFAGFNSICDTLTNEGEEATVEFTSPIHRFFEKKSVMSILFNDDSPILFLAGDRKLFKAPFITMLR
jgi:hypothetical protein